MTHEQTMRNGKIRALVVTILLSAGLVLAPSHAAEDMAAPPAKGAPAASDTLSARQQTIPLIAAYMAVSDMPRLNAALNRGLDAGLTIS